MKVTCPTCQKQVEWGPQSPNRPFCSKRCQLIDLGEWANEEKTIPVEPGQDQDMSEIDIEQIEEVLSQHEQDFFKN
ncbi:DNA gyrase inhibitor YacG [Saliniradius amylolyticus]|uniref:DNA gyrase inhibitor YacG n=1 Tax=Saliniradius amylolyticus TaxID=2183582 RepID=A0A2S2E5V0_9ALTE|nr:DNA gyrase inhibitor YacG [Saliniradius amylolyticus]AWL12912.1 DNA gyrase inhibitor YacG [Saliniradius amylolyticus]